MFASSLKTKGATLEQLFDSSQGLLRDARIGREGRFESRPRDVRTQVSFVPSGKITTSAPITHCARHGA